MASTDAVTSVRHLAAGLVHAGHLLVPVDPGADPPAYDVVALATGEAAWHLGHRGDGGRPWLGYGDDDVRPLPTPHGPFPPKLLTYMLGSTAGTNLLQQAPCPTVASLVAAVELCMLDEVATATEMTLESRHGQLGIGPWTLDDDGLVVGWAVEMVVDHPEYPDDGLEVCQRGLVSLRDDQLDPALAPVHFLLGWAATAAALALCESTLVCPEPAWRLGQRQAVELRTADPDAWLVQLTGP